MCVCVHVPATVLIASSVNVKPSNSPAIQIYSAVHAPSDAALHAAITAAAK